jgi:DNA-binding transcriptional regulator PaaX
MKKKNFKSIYPVSLTDSVFYPFIYKVWHNPKDLPDVKLRCILDFCKYAGYKDGAARTAISRLKQKGILKSIDKQKSGYKLIETFKNRVMQVKNDLVEPGFTLAVFSFSRENEKERYIIRSVLAGTGFKKLAQNTYINIRGRKDELMKKIKKERLEKHLFIFECDNNLDENTVSRLSDIWEINGRVKLLNKFYYDLQTYLKTGGLSGQEIFHMLGYAGTVFSAIFQRTEPPVPEKYLPPDYPLKKIYNYILQKNQEFLADTKRYYIEVNK